MIRASRQEDAAAVLGIYGPVVESTPASFETEVPTENDIAGRMRASHLWLVHERESVVTGYAYAAPFHRRGAYRWSVEVSVYVDEGERGRGVGPLLVARLLEEMRERGFVNAFGGITLPNDASVRLFEDFGFEQIALQKQVGFKLGRWHDVGWWQLHLRDPSVPPPALDA